MTEVTRMRRLFLSTKNLFHRLSFCQFIDELVELPDLFHKRIFNCLHLNTADLAINKSGAGIVSRRVDEK